MSAKDYFPRVREAREALAQKAMDLLEDHMETIKQAVRNGNFKDALEAQRWLIEHLPVTQDGDGVVDASVDKGKLGDGKPTGPAIQIGIAIAPAKSQQALPPANVIDLDASTKD